MKIVTSFKFLFSTLILFVCMSCFKYEEVDKEYDELKNLSENELTKLSLDNHINLDTVNTKILKTSFNMKNDGTKPMKNIFIKGICDCTSFSNYKKILLPGEEQRINITIDLAEEKGNFIKEIFLYGTFYPFTRKIQIIGYRK